MERRYRQITLRAAIFLGAFLLFQIQLMLAKSLLPLFGGVASVWTVCLVFFQTLLFAGYLYARHTNPTLHLVLLLTSLMFLPSSGIAPSSGDPTIALLRTLTIAAAVPFFLLAATSPLLQRWSGLDDPYRLYALSNTGSLLALVSYPFLVEPWLALRIQFTIWRVLYVIFAVLCAACASRGGKRQEPVKSVTWASLTMWTALAAVGSGLLAATTNQICQEIGSFPFLWVGPLALYLVTFVITFSGTKWNRRLWSLLGSLAIPIASALWVMGARAAVSIHLVVDLGTLLVCLMLAHGELARSKPESAALTSFYAAIGAGGALGGAFVALLAPLLFRTYLEFPILLGMSAAVTLLQRYREGEFDSFWTLPPLARASATGLVFSLVTPFLLLDSGSSRIVEEGRNFYGSLRVTEWNDTGGRRRVLTHGATTHGMQFLDERRLRTPTAYYGRTSGIGIAFESLRQRKTSGARVGIIGLGVGTLASYARPGDLFRFYEINPEVTRLAREQFRFLAIAAVPVEIVAGDARLRLQDETPRNYDILVVDAFTSDAIPTHLLTAECGELYKRHLAADGELLIHISNRTLDLEPVTRGLAQRIGYSAFRLDSAADPSQGTNAATWMSLAPGGAPSARKAVVWTDDFASVWRALK